MDTPIITSMMEEEGESLKYVYVSAVLGQPCVCSTDIQHNMRARMHCTLPYGAARKKVAVRAKGRPAQRQLLTSVLITLGGSKGLSDLSVGRSLNLSRLY